MNPERSPIATELFVQWRRARGERAEAAMRPFSRDWENLLEDAGLLSGIDRGDAERDIRTLEHTGWVILKAVTHRPHLIGRVYVPLEAESRWREAFGFNPIPDTEALEIRQFSWAPELAFVRDARLNISFAELRQLNAFFLNGGSGRPLVPIKERSLELFGFEKRLDTLADSALFGEGRLSLEQLRCFVVAEPLGWQRGPANQGPLLVLENAATWDSFRRWNDAHPFFSAVVYGQGNCFVDRVPFLTEIFRELGGSRPVFYFGDLDGSGLRIPARASRATQRLGLPPVEPYLDAYRALLSLAAHATKANEDDPLRREDADWLGPLAEEAWRILEHDQRLAQEWVGWEYLSSRNGGPAIR
jgi:hypothetical protein